MNDTHKSTKYHTKEIILINGREGKKLGFSLSGGAENGSPLVVKNILAGGIAAMDGRLKVGMYICENNSLLKSQFKKTSSLILLKKRLITIFFYFYELKK